MTQAGELYRQVTLITEEYLGPAAERFVARQISFHLDKAPQDLSNEDIPKLIKWTRVTFGLLTEDSRIVDEYSNKIASLVDQEL
jgi:hypothetical protein